MTIVFRKYNANWILKRVWTFKRSVETGKIIWPGQKAYQGYGRLTWPIGVYWITTNEYLVLKLKGDI